MFISRNRSTERYACVWFHVVIVAAAVIIKYLTECVCVCARQWKKASNYTETHSIICLKKGFVHFFPISLLKVVVCVHRCIRASTMTVEFIWYRSFQTLFALMCAASTGDEPLTKTTPVSNIYSFLPKIEYTKVPLILTRLDYVVQRIYFSGK